MKNKMIDGEKLLEWIERNFYREKYLPIVLVDDLKDELESLMSEATADTNVATKPSEWQVGDRIINTDNGLLMVFKKKNHSGWWCLYSRSNDPLPAILLSENGFRNYHNIDAERRALQAEIDALKDPWCYDLEKAPKDGVEFIARVDNNNFCSEILIFCVVKCVFIDSHGGKYDNDEIIAWMPIPEPKDNYSKD